MLCFLAVVCCRGNEVFVVDCVIVSGLPIVESGAYLNR